MANKITKREVINTMLADSAVKGNQMYVDYLTHELELLDKKAANKKPTKTQKENAVLADVVAAVLTDEGATVSEIMMRDASLAALSNQKVSTLLKMLVESDKAVKYTEGKKSLFKAA